MSREPDDITTRRILQLESDLEALRRLVTSPTTILTALEHDHKENQARFSRLEEVMVRLAAEARAGYASMDSRVSTVEAGLNARLNGMEAQLAVILARVPGAQPESDHALLADNLASVIDDVEAMGERLTNMEAQLAAILAAVTGAK